MKIRDIKTLSLITLVTASLLLIHCGPGEKSQAPDIAQEISDQNLDSKLSPFIESIIQANGLPGLAVGVVKEGEVIYARGFGYANIETKTPITVSTLFHTASVSKPFVATAIMQIVEQGKIDLEAPVTAYLPYFRLKDESSKEITIRQMLSHISGMPDVQDYEWDKPQYDEGALERYARSLTDLEMRHAPGKKFAYSNMAFDCLGDVIAKVSGMSFADYEKTYILNPSGMKKSTFLKPEHLPENWASPHLRTLKATVWNGYPYNRSHGPSSTLHSNVLEMCSWAIANMNRGDFQGNRILHPASYDLLWTPGVETGMSGPRKSIGLSWFLGEYKGEKTVGHGGGDIGFNTDFMMLPEKATAVVVLCNISPAPVGQISEAAIDLALGFEPGNFKPPASISVCRTLAEKGHEEAIEHWNSLQADHSEDYDFRMQQFYYIVATSLELDSIDDAQRLGAFCAAIMPEASMEIIRGYVETYLVSNPDNRAGTVFLKIITQKQ